MYKTNNIPYTFQTAETIFHDTYFFSKGQVIGRGTNFYTLIYFTKAHTRLIKVGIYLNEDYFYKSGLFLQREKTDWCTETTLYIFIYIV